MGYFILIILLGIFSWVIWKNPFQLDLPRKTILLGWGLKLMFFFAFFIVVTRIYSDSGVLYGDTGSFFRDGKVLTEYATEDPLGYAALMLGQDPSDMATFEPYFKQTNIWSYGDNGDLLNDNRLIIRINSILHFFSFGNYWVHGLVFAFISFIGVTLLYKAFKPLIFYRSAFFLSLIIAPTVGFWSSGLTKECLLLFSLGLFYFAIRKLLDRLSLIWILFFLISILLLIFNKTHVGLIVIPILTLLLIDRKFPFNRIILVAFGGVLLCGMIIFSYTPPAINMVDRMSNKQQDMINLSKGGIFFINDSAFCAFDYKYLDHFKYDKGRRKIKTLKTTEGEYKLFGKKEFHSFEIQPNPEEYDVYLVIPPAGSFIDVEPIGGSGIQLVKNIPSALFNVLVRPLPADRGPGLKYFVLVDNLVFISFIGFAIYRRKKMDRTQAVWFWYLMISSIILFLLIGWTIPVLGAIARYKMAPHLLVLIAGFILIGPKKQKT